MIFIVILLLIFACEFAFDVGLAHLPFSQSWLFGLTHFIALVLAVAVLFKNFRRKKTLNYKPAFYSFGWMIGIGVPTLPFLPFGLLYFLSKQTGFLYVGFGLSICLTIAIIYGIWRGRWRWNVKEVTIDLPNIPNSLKGKKIIHISDVHIGSFFNQFQKVQPAIDLINKQKADYLFFTGDLVNNLATEMHGWEKIFASIVVKNEKYSILGNHDYADYVPWEKQEEKSKNLEELIEIHRKIGFIPLLNDRVDFLPNVSLLGVENWGIKPFRQSGDLSKVLNETPVNDFKILLSHDPSHFDEQVKEKTNINLTLSGHTHGMQFGIERFGIKWSPVSFRYKKWAGLYQEGNQLLYVNRGFGYIGFPGRVGIYPEITVLKF